MKKIHPYTTLILLLLAVSTGFAQLQTTVNANNNNLGALATYGPDGANIGNTSVVINPPKNIEGSLYLFEQWNNKGVFITSEERKLLIRNINFNIDRGVFESEISKDTVFTFGFENVDRVFVNSREFKARFIPSKGLYDVYEVIFENDEFAILKKWFIDIKEGSDNPMVNRKSRYVHRSNYYLERNGNVELFKFKKKNLLKLAGNQADEVEAYAKKYNLSFKKEIDVSRMFSFLLK
ncbi:hypothetical protein [Gilvibacter sp.]|uniref:hypothetical protein n=1 Tax=Gilvibacter sp. TaxID=2729997 RepID=UPI003F49F34E